MFISSAEIDEFVSKVTESSRGVLVLMSTDEFSIILFSRGDREFWATVSLRHSNSALGKGVTSITVFRILTWFGIVFFIRN